MSFNKIVLVGNIGRNPEVRFTPQGQQVCEFSLATNEKKANGDTETTWFQITLWGKLAEVSEYLSKGRLVYVEGRLRVREWTDKEGRTRFNLEVIGTELKFLGNRAETANEHEQQPTQNATTIPIVQPQIVQTPLTVAPASPSTPVVREEPLPKSSSKTRNYKTNGKVTVSDPFI